MFDLLWLTIAWIVDRAVLFCMALALLSIVIHKARGGKFTP
jgi:hypothetical protein